MKNYKFWKNLDFILEKNILSVCGLNWFKSRFQKEVENKNIHRVRHGCKISTKGAENGAQ